MQNGEPSIYVGLATLRNGQVNRRWQRLQMLLVFNMIAIPIVLGTANVELKAALCHVGYVIHGAILVASWRGERWNRLWSRKMGGLERLDQSGRSGDKKSRVSVFSSPEYTKLQRSATQFTKGAYIFAGMVVIAWMWVAWHFTLQVQW